MSLVNHILWLITVKTSIKLNKLKNNCFTLWPSYNHFQAGPCVSMLSRQCRYLLLGVTFSGLAGDLDTITTIKCHHLLDGYVHYQSYLLFLVIYISTFIWYTAARYGVPCYNSAEAAQLTREAHGGQHEAANGRDFNMEKIFRAVIVNVYIIARVHI